MLAAMTALHVGVFAVFLSIGLGIASIVGYFRWRIWKQQLRVWQDFAATRGWRFESTPGRLFSAGTLKLEGEHAGRPFTMETEHRRQGKHVPIITIVRHELGDGFPREVTIRPETLGDKFFKLVGVKQDEELGDARLDAALDLKNVTPHARAVLLSAGMRRPLLNLVHVFHTFTIEDGTVAAEVVDDVPRTLIELDVLMSPVRELGDAVQDTRGHTAWRADAAGEKAGA